jgi:hypothetical protein
VFKRVRRESPASYLKVCAMLVPKELKFEHSGGVKAMTDEEIERATELIKAMIAERDAGATRRHLGWACGWSAQFALWVGVHWLKLFATNHIIRGGPIARWHGKQCQHIAVRSVRLLGHSCGSTDLGRINPRNHVVAGTARRRANNGAE